MSLSFKFSSPGKIILFGEHAVVYGRSAISTAVSIRTQLKGELVKSLNPRIVVTNYGKAFEIDPRSAPPTEVTQKMLHSAFSTILGNHSLILDIDGELPVSSGMGSSAALCSLVAATMDRISGSPFNLDSIQTKAMKLEQFYHLKSSGIDPVTVIRGGCIWFRDGHFKKFDVPKVPVAIIDTGREKSTAVSVKKVAEMIKDRPDIYRKIINELGRISDRFYKSNPAKQTEIIGRLFQEANGLLEAFDLGCPESDEIFKRSAENNLSAKISGGGMGGIVLAVGPNIANAKNIFHGFHVYDAQIGEEGIREE